MGLIFLHACARPAGAKEAVCMNSFTATMDLGKPGVMLLPVNRFALTTTISVECIHFLLFKGMILAQEDEDGFKTRQNTEVN